MSLAIEGDLRLDGVFQIGTYLQFWAAAVFFLCYWRTSPKRWLSIFNDSQQSERRIRQKDQSSKCHSNYTFLRRPQRGDPKKCEESRLKYLHPDSTHEERERFLKACNGSLERASEKLGNFLEWKSRYSIPGAVEKETAIGDLETWRMASESAMRAQGYYSANPTELHLPRIARMYDLHGVPYRDLKGRRMIQIIPGQMDERIVSLKTYALTVALYIDRVLPRNSLEKVTVLIDARGGNGWRNLNAVQLMPFIKHTSHLLLQLFPERLAHAQVYPVPHALSWIWTAVSACIDPVTRQKISLLTGPATIVSPIPAEQMELYIGPDTVRHLEETRISEFINL